MHWLKKTFSQCSVISENKAVVLFNFDPTPPGTDMV